MLLTQGAVRRGLRIQLALLPARLLSGPVDMRMNLVHMIFVLSAQCIGLLAKSSVLSLLPLLLLSLHTCVGTYFELVHVLLRVGRQLSFPGSQLFFECSALILHFRLAQPLWLGFCNVA